MVPILTVEREYLGVAGFVLLLLIEAVRPFRRPVESRWRRYVINVFIAGSNALLLSVLLGGLIISCYHTFELHRVGFLHRLGIMGWGNVLFTVVLLDGVTYAWHRAYHGIPLMWRMHRVHHSDRDLDVTTSGRFHLTEMVLSAIFRLGVIALIGAEVASVVMFEIVFGLLNQLEHANLRIPQPFEDWLRWIIVTPDMHRIHHSRETAHTNSNYSTIFSFWDRVFGTYQFGENQARLAIGLPEYHASRDVTFAKVFAMPFGPPCRLAEKLAVASGALLLIASLAVGRSRMASAQGLAPHQRGVALTYTARIAPLPLDAQAVRVWIPLAKTSAEQEVLERTVQAPVPFTVEREPAYGNDILYVSLTPPLPRELSVSIQYEALLHDGETTPFHEPAPSSLQRYESPEGLVVIDDEIRARAQQATVGRTTLLERARAIYEDVKSRMAYDKTTPGWGRGDTRRACLLGKGNCTDFHSLFISMARAAAIPSRFKIGVVVPPESSGTISGYHCWAEFYDAARGWVSVGASEAWKHPELSARYFGSWDANRFLLSVGRSLQLEPPQQGEPVNMFLYPYVEINGAPFEGVETVVAFQALNQKEDG